LWQTHTTGATRAEIQVDCNFVLYNKTGPLWASNSSCKTVPTPPPTPRPPTPAPAPTPQPPPRRDLKFFVVGDWGGDNHHGHPTSPAQIDDAEEMASFAKDLGGVDFIVGVGDNFYPKGVTDVNDQRFKTTFEDVYYQQELQCPWYILAGNHDHIGNVTAQLEYHHRSERWIFPELWYTFSESFTTTSGKTITTQFVYIDTSGLFGQEEEDEETGEVIWEPHPLQAFADDQVAWINKTLAESTADYLWVAGHYPIYDPKSVDPRKRDLLVPLFIQYNASGFIAGHCHTMQHFDSKGADKLAYIMSGCGTECNNPPQPTDPDKAWPGVTQNYRYSKNPAVNSAFVYMVVNDTATSIRYISDKGDLMYEARAILPRK